ncbi:TerB family tellurite resistance protein [Flexithrix dorotheae]|uniref:TerB family tellurite resistance protein n=1 Tax=Flexithrix dorotheae TaxID=70993 RepID=UPI00035DD0B8|nr:TerB family tellurite resistance protein [Flexithrix dorotheae]
MNKRISRNLSKAERKALRQQRRTERKTARQERRLARKKNGGKLKIALNTKINTFFDKEFEKIRIEREEKALAQPLLKKHLNDLVGQYVLKAVINAAKSGVLPGVLGMATLIPEIVGSVKNQLRMVYDIGLANGYKGDFLHKDLVIYVLLEALSKKTTGITLLEGNKMIVKPTGEKIPATIIKILSTIIVRQLVKSIVCKWLPGLGGLAVTAWSQHSTKKVANKASGSFSKEIEISPKIVTIPTLEQMLKAEENLINQEDDDADFLKLMTLISLMKMDGNIHINEIALFEEILKNSDLDEDEKDEIEDNLHTEEIIDLELDFFKNNDEEALALMMDLVALAKSDKSVHSKESSFLFEVAEEIGFNRQELIQILIK